MSLSLSREEIQQARECWNNVQSNNKYHKDQFITRLFSNLLAANSDLRSFFKSDVTIREHTLFFNDLLNYVVIYLDNIERLNKVLLLFLKENEDLVRGINYLEQMGTALIQTFRQWIGRGLFNEKVESYWVQIYIHLANNILLYCDDSDASSYCESVSESMEGVEALNIKKAEPVNELPMTPRSPSLEPVEEDNNESLEDEYEKSNTLFKKPSIQVNIKSNDKYKGFRRNDSNTVSIESALPEPSLPERSPRRIQAITEIEKPGAIPTKSLTAKFNDLPPRIVYDEPEDIEPQDKGFGFDPRKSNKKKSGFFETFEDIEAKALPKVPIDEKPVDLDITLEPVDESSDNEVDIDTNNDNSSSIYHSDNSEPSSHQHSLSLHSHFSDGTDATEPMSLQKMELRSMNSNEYKSDSSSVENNRVFSKPFNSRQTSISSVEPEFMVPKSTVSRTSSQADLALQKSIQLSQKASLGFMRSSFILKKEIETMGFNKPENVFMKPPTIPAAMNSSPKLQNKVSNLESSSEEEDESFDLLNTFMPITESSKARLQNLGTSSCSNLPKTIPKSHPTLHKQSRSVSNLSIAKHNNYKPMECASCTQSIRQSNTEIGKVKGKRSFRDKLKSLFSASKTDITTSSISSPIETTYSTNSAIHTSMSKSSRGSFSSGPYSNYSKASRVSSHTTVDQTRSEAEDKFTLMNSSRKVDKRASTSDLRSINTTGSNESTSGFSFFNKRNSIDSRYSSRGQRSKNKYQVTKTPYDIFAHNKLVFSN